MTGNCSEIRSYRRQDKNYFRSGFAPLINTFPGSEIEPQQLQYLDEQTVLVLPLKKKRRNVSVYHIARARADYLLLFVSLSISQAIQPCRSKSNGTDN